MRLADTMSLLVLAGLVALVLALAKLRLDLARLRRECGEPVYRTLPNGRRQYLVWVDAERARTKRQASRAGLGPVGAPRPDRAQATQRIAFHTPQR